MFRSEVMAEQVGAALLSCARSPKTVERSNHRCARRLAAASDPGISLQSYEAASLEFDDFLVAGKRVSSKRASPLDLLLVDYP